MRHCARAKESRRHKEKIIICKFSPSIYAKWELRGCCERQVCIDWLTFKMLGPREETAFQKQIRCCVEAFHENNSLIDDTDSGWQWMTQKMQHQNILQQNLLETAASPPRNKTNCPGWKPAGTLNQSVKSSTFDWTWLLFIFAAPLIGFYDFVLTKTWLERRLDRLTHTCFHLRLEHLFQARSDGAQTVAG